MPDRALPQRVYVRGQSHRRPAEAWVDHPGDDGGRVQELRHGRAGWGLRERSRPQTARDSAPSSRLTALHPLMIALPRASPISNATSSARGASKAAPAPRPAAVELNSKFEPTLAQLNEALASRAANKASTAIGLFGVMLRLRPQARSLESVRAEIDL